MRTRRAFPREDITGRRFGRLVATGFDQYVEDEKGRRKAWWHFMCDCGTTCTKLGNAVRNGETTSCGCRRKEAYAEQAARAITRNSKPLGVAERNDFLNSYRQRARRKGHSFLLSEEQFFSFCQIPCHYCGVSPSAGTAAFRRNGIDRLDSSRGYELDNCVACCEICNKAKRDMTYDDFKTWIQRISDYNAR